MPWLDKEAIPFAVSSSELAELDGVVGPVFPQASTGPGFAVQASLGAAATVRALQAADLPSGIDASKIGDGSVSSTEFGHLNGVTGPIQPQLDGKMDEPSGVPDGTKYLRDDNSWQPVSGGIPYCGYAATANSIAYTATAPGSFTLSDGVMISVLWPSANVNTATTLNVNGTGAKSVKFLSGQLGNGVRAIVANELVTDDVPYLLAYNLGFDCWVVIGPSGNHLESTGGTLTGTLQMTGNHTSPAGTASYINKATSGEIRMNTPSTCSGVLMLMNNVTLARFGEEGLVFGTNTVPNNQNGSISYGSNLLYLRGGSSGIHFGAGSSTQIASISSAGITISTTAAPADYGIGRSASPTLQLRGPSNGVDFLAGSSTVQARACVRGIEFPNNNTAPTTHNSIGQVSGNGLSLNSNAGVSMCLNGAKVASTSAFGFLVQSYPIMVITANTGLYPAMHNNSGLYDLYMSCGATGESGLAPQAVGANFSGVYAWGLTHANKGAVGLFCGPITISSADTWTDFFPLAGASFYGAFELYGSNASLFSLWGVSGSTLDAAATESHNPIFVAEGAVGASNVGIRISGGAVQLRRGSSVSAGIEFGLIFKGIRT